MSWPVLGMAWSHQVLFSDVECKAKSLQRDCFSVCLFCYKDSVRTGFGFSILQESLSGIKVHRRKEFPPSLEFASWHVLLHYQMHKNTGNIYSPHQGNCLCSLLETEHWQFKLDPTAENFSWMRKKQIRMRSGLWWIWPALQLGKDHIPLLFFLVTVLRNKSFWFAFSFFSLHLCRSHCSLLTLSGC